MVDRTAGRPSSHRSLNPTREPQIGWAAGLQQTDDGKEILLSISSMELSKQATCMELKDNQFIDTACAPNCDATEEANRPE